MFLTKWEALIKISKTANLIDSIDTAFQGAVVHLIKANNSTINMHQGVVKPCGLITLLYSNMILILILCYRCAFSESLYML